MVNKRGRISRRSFLRGAGSVASGVAIGSMIGGLTSASSASAAEGASLTVLDPSGANAITNLFTSRLPDLNGKVIAELAVDETKWQPHRTFPYIQELIKSRYPTVEFLPMSEFPQGLQVNDDNVAEMVKQRGADAAIIGNAA